MLSTIKCANCGKETETYQSSKRYCSPKCARIVYATKDGMGAEVPGLPPSSTGTLNELRVSADLISKGFYVFKSLTPNSPCDVVIMKNNILLRVEVKTMSKSVSGEFRTPKPKDRIYDIVAYSRGSKIIYVPELPIV